MNVKEFQESTKFNKFYINSQNIRSPNVKARGLWVNVLGLFYSVLTKWVHLAYRFSFFPWDAIFIWGLRKASILFPVLCDCVLTWNIQCLRSYYEPKILRNVPSVSCFRFSDYHFISFIPSFIWTPEPWNEIEVSWQCSSWLLFTWIS